MSDSKPVTETVTKTDKREHNVDLKTNSELKQSLLVLDSEYTSISDSNNFPRHKPSITDIKAESGFSLEHQSFPEIQSDIKTESIIDTTAKSSCSLEHQSFLETQTISESKATSSFLLEHKPFPEFDYTNFVLPQHKIDYYITESNLNFLDTKYGDCNTLTTDIKSSEHNSADTECTSGYSPTLATKKVVTGRVNRELRELGVNRLLADWNPIGELSERSPYPIRQKYNFKSRASVRKPTGTLDYLSIDLPSLTHTTEKDTELDICDQSPSLTDTSDQEGSDQELNSIDPHLNLLPIMADAPAVVDQNLGMLGCPKSFTGADLTYTITDFLACFDRFVTYKKLNDDQKLSTLRMLLDDGAARFFDRSAVHNDLAQIRTALIDRFKLPTVSKLELTAQLWQTSQNPAEKTQDYIDSIRHKGSELGITNNEIRSIILKGLHPSVRPYILQNGHDDMAALLQSAKLADQSISIHTQDSSLVAMVSDLKSKIDNLTLSAVNVVQEKSVSFNDRVDRPYSSRNPQNTSHSRERHRSLSRDRTSRTPSPWPRKSHDIGSFRDSAFNRGRPNFNSQDTSRYVANNKSCFKCGKQYSPSHKCPAIGKQCRRCNKMNHFAIVCRQVRSRTSNYR